MAKFVINEGAEFSERTIEANGYEEKNGYFHFYDDEGQVFSIITKQVGSITRKPS